MEVKKIASTFHPSQIKDDLDRFKIFSQQAQQIIKSLTMEELKELFKCTEEEIPFSPGLPLDPYPDRHSFNRLEFRTEFNLGFHLKRAFDAGYNAGYLTGRAEHLTARLINTLYKPPTLWERIKRKINL